MERYTVLQPRVAAVSAIRLPPAALLLFWALEVRASWGLTTAALGLRKLPPRSSGAAAVAHLSLTTFLTGGFFHLRLHIRQSVPER